MMFAKAYFVTLIIFLSLDFLWLGLIAKDFYGSQLENLMRANINYLAAGLFYLLYVGGIVFFAVEPALIEENWRKAAISGALLGLIAYGTYDMTNLATLKHWPLNLSIVDMIWGSCLTSLSSVFGFLITRALP